MIRFTSLLFLVVLCGVFYLAIYNSDSVRLHLTKELAYDLPLIALMAVSTIIGAALMFVIFFIRDTRNYIQSRLTQKKRKKEEMSQVLYSKAVNYAAANLVDEAVVELQNVLKENPEHIPSIVKLADTYSEKNETMKAMELYHKALTMDSGNIEVLFKSLDVRIAQGVLHEAEETADKILVLEPHNALALYKKREIFEQQSRWDELIHLQKTILKSLPDNDSHKEAQERILHGYEYEYGRQSLENSEIEKARKVFKEVIKYDKSFIPAHLGLAEVFLLEGNTESGINYLEKVHKETNSLIILARLEDLLINESEPSRLIRIYKNALSDNPEADAIKLFLGKLYYRLEMLDEALDIFNSFDSTSTYSEVHKIKGSLYLRRNECEKAAAEFLKVIGLKRALRIPYICLNCKHEATDWEGRCPSCKSWNTYDFNFDKHQKP
ncbi:MAG: DUF1049 domain-containing protein [Nitrospirae bacterium]|nr:DUF1049 domain-containing protein [Nitrospirota bacterium]